MFVEILMTLLSTINSIYMTFSTIIGSTFKIFNEFSSRIQQLFYRLQMSAIRIKFLMGRVFGIMYSVMFMGMSGIKAGQNFSNTFLFKFIDTFCFDPATKISVKDKGLIYIKDVVIGDVLADGQKVTATFSFYADGQEMVRLPSDILVSTNHYVAYNGKWIQAIEHPHAQPVGEWSGGFQKPLICLNTDTHTFTIGKYVFRDYDETSDGDADSMKKVLESLNGGSPAPAAAAASSEMACSPETLIKLKDGSSVPASNIRLGDRLSHGIVSGIVDKECHGQCTIGGESFAPATTLWSPQKNQWIRASSLTQVQDFEEARIFKSFVVVPSATIETSSGKMFRDYVEIHSPDVEKAYAEALAETEC